MLRLIMFLCFITFLFSCQKEDNTTDIPVNDMVPMGDMILAGTFSGTPGHTVKGTIKVFEKDGIKEIRLEGFSATNGPDLKIYLSKELSASNFISLGSLKSISGNQNYSIPGMPDLKEYKYVLVWCEQFTVLFGSALLG